MDTGKCSGKVQASFCQMGAKRGKKQVREQQAEGSAATASCSIPSPLERGGVLLSSTLSVRLKPESPRGCGAVPFPGEQPRCHLPFGLALPVWKGGLKKGVWVPTNTLLNLCPTPTWAGAAKQTLGCQELREKS